MPPLKWLPYVLGLAAVAASAQAAPLTYEQALALAASSPDLRARTLGVEAAESAARAAGRLPDPRLTFGLDNFPISGPAAGRFGSDEMTMARVGLMQDLPSRAQRRAAGEIAQADVGAARADEAVESLSGRAEAAMAWIDLFYAKKRLAALNDIVATLEPLVAAAPVAVTSGRSRPGQTVEPLQWLAGLEDRRSMLLAEQEKARAVLARWTGDPSPDLAGPAPELQVDAEALRAGLAHHPLILRSSVQISRAEAELSAARAGSRPDWSVEASYGRRNPDFGDMVSLGASVSLPLFKSTRQAPVIAARTTDLARREAETQAALRKLTADLDSDLAVHAMHHDMLLRAEETLRPLAERRSDLETASYAAGTAGLGDVFAAFSALADMRLEVLQREAETVRDAARLNLIYGGSHP